MKRRRILTALGVTFAVLCVALTVGAAYLTRMAKPGLAQYLYPTETQTVPSDGESVGAASSSPVRFQALQKVNSDAIAWLRIPGTQIDYPILYREGENDYYLRRDLYEKSSNAGSLFIEDYNSADFNDPVTVVYGHHLSSGEMFGTLQTIYTNAETFQQNQEIVVYFPEKELHYKVFCAVPLDNSHILYYHDFNSELVFNQFFDEVYQIRTLQAVQDQTLKPVVGDRVLMLSTCFNTDYSRRFVVMAVCTEETVY